ncbi:uncharacterized protein B0I36DRAFT_355936 [Microdochium trichocladiopsis]|uniref:Uncharacterized protein n=1 Tax=Microdochium trichocladiopsis TaxID=1682393 RepID=A0A9P8XR28_9PEZI|nr:uncharacterized protein B0I36DRAFT_355936 [Microdochium trichocladiopsis]KAH7012540.1 hypothetical protein B0I36DRAFT_355936 [Microdochium trichocladiopsis]
MDPIPLERLQTVLELAPGGESLIGAIVREDYREHIANHCGTVLSEWVQLVGKTTLPPNVSSSDPCILAAFQALHAPIFTPDSKALTRMAYVRLIDLFSKVELIVKSDRRKGKSRSKKRRGNTRHNRSIAIDLCTCAFQTTRPKVLEIRRQARRWRQFASPSVFCLMIYTEDVIEEVM